MRTKNTAFFPSHADEQQSESKIRKALRSEELLVGMELHPSRIA